MIRNLMSALIALCALTVGAAAQLGEPVIRTFLTPQDVRLEAVRGSAGWQLAIETTLPDGCTEPISTLLQVSGNAWFVAVYRELPPDVLCAAVMSPLTITLPADDLFVEAEDGSLPRFVVVNDVIFAIDRLSSVGTVPALTLIEQRSPIDVGMVTFEQAEIGMADVIVSGTPTDPCGIPLHRASAVWDSEGLYQLEWYTVRLAPEATCDREAEELGLTLTDQMFFALQVNGASVPYNTFVPADEQRPYHLINRLPIETFEAEWGTWLDDSLRALLRVTGTTDGCEGPNQIAVQRLDATTYRVEAVRVLPLETLCTMIARPFSHEQWVAVPTDAPITFIVNGEPITLDQP